MLVYVRRSEENPDATSTAPPTRVPPCHVMTAIDELNNRYHKKCEEYSSRWLEILPPQVKGKVNLPYRTEAHLARFYEIREQVMGIYRLWETSSTKVTPSPILLSPPHLRSGYCCE